METGRREKLINDLKRCRALVNWCFIVDTAHTAGTLWMIWVYAVDNFSNTRYLGITLWPISAAPLFVCEPRSPIHPISHSTETSAAHVYQLCKPYAVCYAQHKLTVERAPYSVSTPIQLLFAWRIKHFTRTNWLATLLSFLSIATFALGLLAAIRGLVTRT